ncbi:MAG: type 1 glutamine amidotransferase [Candidatus Zixiibacteriota bacterium]
MRVLIIQNCAPEGLGLYEDYLKENKIEHQVFHAYTGKRFPSQKQFDAFIIGGTPLSVREIRRYPFMMNERKYIKKAIAANNPVFGICGGGQLVASALGARVRKNPVMEIGGCQVKLTSDGKKSRFFRGFPSKFEVFHWHGDTFDIPESGKRLAESADCQNQAFAVGKAIGVQFHIEVTAKTASRWSDEYPGELKIVKKSKSRVVRECRAREAGMKKLVYQLMNNWLGR